MPFLCILRHSLNMWTNDDKLAEKSNQFSVRFVWCANMWLHHYIISSILFLYKQVASLGLKNRSRIYIAIQTAIMDFCNVWCKMCLISCKVCWLVVIHGSKNWCIVWPSPCTRGLSVSLLLCTVHWSSVPGCLYVSLVLCLRPLTVWTGQKGFHTIAWMLVYLKFGVA